MRPSETIQVTLSLSILDLSSSSQTIHLAYNTTSLDFSEDTFLLSSFIHLTVECLLCARHWKTEPGMTATVAGEVVSRASSLCHLEQVPTCRV